MGFRFIHLLILVALLCMSAASVVRASSLLELMGAPNASRPYTARVRPTGPAATYFNPALLVDLPQSFHLGFVAVFQFVDIGLDARPAGADIPASIYDARAVGGDGTERLEFRPLPTDRLRNTRGSAGQDAHDLFLSLGHVATFLRERLAVGVYAIFPLGEFQAHRPFFVDEREQYFSNSLHFELLEDRLDLATFAFAVAGRPVPWLSLGAGITLTTSTEPQTDLYVPEADEQETAEINSDAVIRFRVTPYFGLAATPVDGLRLAATVHLESKSDVDGSTDLQFWDYPYPEGQTSLVHQLKFAYGFLPLRVGFGVDWSSQAGLLRYSVSASALWAQWSQYRDRHAQRPFRGWHDTFSGAVGVSLGWSRHDFGLDLAYMPSPVPSQPGRTSYVDNDRVGLALGYEVAFEVGDVVLGGTAQLQFQWLVPRRETKRQGVADPVLDEFPSSVNIVSGAPIAASAGLQSNSPGYPGYRSDGWILGAGVSFRLLY